jgi:hypothetical protein
MSPFRRIILLSIALLTAHGLRGEEGMWMPQEMPQLAAGLQALGKYIEEEMILIQFQTGTVGAPMEPQPV